MSDLKAPPPLPTSELHSPLPPDVVPSMTWWPFRYRKYPVFSLPWLKKRTVLATVLIAAYGVISALVNWKGGVSWGNALGSSAYFIVGGVVMVTGGPALAAWVRHRRFPVQVEAWLILVAVVLGFVIAMVADLIASLGIASCLKLGDIDSEVTPGASELDEARLGLFVIGSVVFHFVISGSLAAMAYFSERRRLRARALHLAVLDTDMKLAVLQAQIEPHFLFNTLASIRPLIRQDAEKAESALDALADHLRATIPQMRSGNGRGMSTLGQQVDICASYLSVMQVRMGTRLHCELEVSQELRSKEFPPLVLLSLVENAIKHGLEPKPGPGAIVVRASFTGSDLRVSVSDDGQGLQEGVSGGLGLANIREQLQVRYGGRARLTVAPRPEGGTMAEIMIPVNP